MAILNDITCAIGRALASTTFAVTVDVTDNADTETTQSPAPEREGAKVDHVPLINRLSHIMSKAPDGIYLRVTVPDVNFVFAMVPGGAVLVGEGPLYHGETIDLTDTVPRLTMRRISPGAWCEKPPLACSIGAAARSILSVKVAKCGPMARRLGLVRRDLTHPGGGLMPLARAQRVLFMGFLKLK